MSHNLTLDIYHNFFNNLYSGDIDNDHSTSSSDLSQQEALSDDADWLQKLDLGPDDSTSEL